MVGEILQELREDKNWTQADLAELLGISRSAIASYETNRAQVPQDTLIQYAEIFNVNIDYLLGHTRVRTSWKDFTIELSTDSEPLKIDKMISKLKYLSPHGRGIIDELTEALLQKEKYTK